VAKGRAGPTRRGPLLWHEFGPGSVQFKGEISDAFARKRHRRRHLEFCTALLLSRGSGVRIPPGAPSFWKFFINHFESNLSIGFELRSSEGPIVR
jgi:hypothetical protein